MTRTSILLDTELLLQLKQTARTNGKTLAAVMREALTNYLGQQPPPRKLSFIGIGSSGKGNLSVNVEKILQQKFRSPKKS